jgi:peptidoglycan-associated lipoprotein
MKILRLLASIVFLWLALLSLPQNTLADEYDESQAHPLRFTVYFIHPAGVAAEWLVTRPFHALVSVPGLDYIFGHRPHPQIFDEPQEAINYGATKRVVKKQRVARSQTPPEKPTAERVKVQIKEVVVEKPVIQEVTKIVEVERVVFSDIAFQFNSSKLTDLGKGRIYLVAQRLMEKSDVVVVLEGHADVIGDEEFNMQLGLRRAETVKMELEQLGIPPERMSVASLGETKPLIDKEDSWARAVNRRVEFMIEAKR